MEFIQIIGGVFLILFALRYLRKGFGRVMGGDLLDWLQKHTRSRWRSLGGGMVAGTVMPSSTAMAFLSVEMSRAGKVAWPNVFAVLLGAQVGITVLVQVLSLNLGDYAPIFLLIGGWLFLYFKTPKVRGVGQVALALAFLLTAMNLISGAARAVSNEPAVIDLFAALAGLPLLLFAGAAILTFALQSSTASIAVAMGLAAGGQVTTPMLLLWVLGANIGLCFTVLAAGWSRMESRRLGTAVLLVKFPLAVVLLIALQSGDWVSGLPGGISRQAAWAHTLFNLLAITGVPAAVLIARVVNRIMPTSGVDHSDGVRLDPMLLQHPSLAVSAALREALRIFDGLHVMREEVVGALRCGTLSPHLEPSLAVRASSIGEIRSALVNFLDDIEDGSLDPGDARMKDALDDLMYEIPVMMRTLQRDLPAETRGLLASDQATVEKARPVLIEAADRCARLMEAVARMLMQEKPELGESLLERKRENSAWMIAAKKQHAGLPDAAWEIIDDFQQLNRRLGGVAYVYCRDQPGSSEL